VETGADFAWLELIDVGYFFRFADYQNIQEKASRVNSLKILLKVSKNTKKRTNSPLFLLLFLNN
jgi:hypothetical protein